MGTKPLTELPTTNSGAVSKQHALKWLQSLDGDTYRDLQSLGTLDPDDRELIDAVTVKPNEFTGSTYAAPVSNIRLTGTPEFITQAARRFAPLVVFESDATYLSINLQRTEDRDTGKLTDNYALYLSACERGGEAKAARAFLPTP